MVEKSWSAQFRQGIQLKPRQRKALSSEDSNLLGRMRMFSNLEVFNVCTCDWTGLPRRNGTRRLFGRWIKGSESIGEVDLSPPAGGCLRNLLVFQILFKCVCTSGSKNCWRQILIFVCFLGFSPPLTPFFFSFLRGKEDSCPNELI